MIIRRRYLYIILSIVVILVIVPKLCNLYNSICVTSKDWNDFGNYFNNYLTPILTIINIIILYELTISVSNVDKSRTQAELNLQKNLLLLKYRREAIETFYKETSNFFDVDYTKDKNKVEPHTTEYLTRFINLDLPFFDFGEHQQAIERDFNSLVVDINLLHDTSRKTGEIDHERWQKIANKRENLLKVLRANAVGLTNTDMEHLTAYKKGVNSSDSRSLDKKK